MFFLGGIIVGLLLNYLFGGFDFSTLLCFFAGLFLIMPLLVKFSFNELKYVLHHKKALLWNIVLNFVLFPVLAFLIWYFIFGTNHYLTAALVLLALIPGWGLLMSWLHHTKADLKLGFSIFAVNLFLFSFAYLVFSAFVDYFVAHNVPNQKVSISNSQPAKWVSFSTLPINYQHTSSQPTQHCAIQEVSQKIGADLSCFSSQEAKTFIYGIYGFFVLIFLPFLISRVIRKSKFLFRFFQKYGSWISKLSAFLIVTYIFSLKYVRQLAELDFVFLLKLTMAVIILYGVIFIWSFVFYKKSDLPLAEKKAIFWNAYVRFITLSFVLSFLYAIAWNYPSLILIFIIAYFVQIVSAIVISRWVLK